MENFSNITLAPASYLYKKKTIVSTKVMDFVMTITDFHLKKK